MTVEAITDKAVGGDEVVRDKAAGGVEEPVIESPVKAVPVGAVCDKAAGGVEALRDKVVGKAVEVIDKVEEPGVDAKVVEGRMAW